MDENCLGRACQRGIRERAGLHRYPTSPHRAPRRPVMAHRILQPCPCSLGQILQRYLPAKRNIIHQRPVGQKSGVPCPSLCIIDRHKLFDE